MNLSYTHPRSVIGQSRRVALVNECNYGSSTPVLESRDLNYPPKLKSGESKLATPKVRDDQDHEPQEQSKHLDQGLPKEGQRPGQDHGRYPDDGGSQEEKTKPHRRGNGRSYNSSRGGLWIHPLNVGYA